MKLFWLPLCAVLPALISASPKPQSPPPPVSVDPSRLVEPTACGHPNGVLVECDDLCSNSTSVRYIRQTRQRELVRQDISQGLQNPDPSPNPPTSDPNPLSSIFGIFQGGGGGSRNELRRRIVGGFPAVPGDVPGQVALLKLKTDSSGNVQTWEFFCGGVLVSLTAVVTAAHCLYDSGLHLRPSARYGGPSWGDIVVKVGSISSAYDPTESDRFKIYYSVRHVIVHDKYRQGNDNANDIAILILCDVVVAPNVSPPVIPPQDNPEVPISGWGATNPANTRGSSQTNLRLASVETQDFESCNRAYNGQLEKGAQICALGVSNGQVNDTCSGDSGGPLIYTGGGSRNELYGIVSFGPDKCADPRFPGVYIYIPHYAQWINNVKNAPHSFFGTPTSG